MKRYFLQQSLVAALALLAIPAAAFAQKKNEKEVNVTKDDVQQIIITRKGDTDIKTVIEIKGDKVLVNGKDASKAGNITVHLNRLNDLKGLTVYRKNGDNNDFRFDFNNDLFHSDDISLFSEDANRAMLGVTTDEADNGAKITAITKESSAAKAGLKVGDVITRIGDDDIDDADDVSRAVRTHKPGDKVGVTIQRDGKEQKVTAELGKWKGVRITNLNAPLAPAAPLAPNAPEIYAPRGDAYGNFSYNFNGAPKLGLTVQDTDEGKGVKVLDVAAESNAAKAGVKKDDIITQINEEEVNTTDEVRETISDARGDASVKLQVQRAGKPQTIEVRIPRKLKTADL